MDYGARQIQAYQNTISHLQKSSLGGADGPLVQSCG